ncbi:hypothetical protein EOD23_35170, partial [Mesorhizobium sp. USDA-HM6]
MKRPFYYPGDARPSLGEGRAANDAAACLDAMPAIAHGRPGSRNRTMEVAVFILVVLAFVALSGALVR